MSYWIYNMGLPMQVSPQTLLDKKRVKPLSALAGTSDFTHEIKEEHKLKTRPNPLDSYNQEQPNQPKDRPVFSPGHHGKKCGNTATRYDIH